MGNAETFIANDIARVCQRLDRKGFGANHDGNVTVRRAEKISATPGGVSKADVAPEMILTLDTSGKKIAGHGKPFSELDLHLAAYRARPDISAVVHAHPPYATARGLAGKPLDAPCIPEAVVSLGRGVPLARFAMPGDPAIAGIVAKMLEVANAFMMPGNGVLAVGTDVWQAYLRLELVEHLATIDFIATHMGKPMSLSDADIAALLEKRAAAGLAPPSEEKNSVRAEKRTPAIASDEVRAIIAEEVRRALGRCT